MNDILIDVTAATGGAAQALDVGLEALGRENADAIHDSG
jgi:hypothetical protein